MPDARKKGKPNAWVTHISGLLSGEKRCEWSAWYRSRFWYKKRPSDFDSDAWTAEHNALVTARANSLRASGHRVGVEDDNKFSVHGRTANLGGKTDLFVVKDGRVIVWDVKTGKERESDRWQIRLYLWAYPKVIPNLTREMSGVLEYKGPRQVWIDPPTPPETAKIATIMQMIGSDIEPPKVPSRFECQFCDIACCDKRDETPVATAETTEF